MRSSIAFFLSSAKLRPPRSTPLGALGFFFARPLRSASVCPALRGGSAATAALASLSAGMVGGMGGL